MRLDDKSEAGAEVKLEMEGFKSKRWIYQRGSLTAAVAVDYPFCGFHNLAVCYANSGWGSLTIRTFERTDVAPFTTCIMGKPLTYGYVHFALIDETGRWLKADERLSAGLLGRLNRLLDAQQDRPMPAYQVQVLCQSYSPLPPEQQELVVRLFLAAREQLAAQIMGQLEKRP
jgi:hypothetical protein